VAPRGAAAGNTERVNHRPADDRLRATRARLARLEVWWRTTLPPIGAVRTIMLLDRNGCSTRVTLPGRIESLPPDSAGARETCRTTGPVGALRGRMPRPLARGTCRRESLVPHPFHASRTVTRTAVFIEFDASWGTARVHQRHPARNHPYGYVSFRYDMTKSIKFGAENYSPSRPTPASSPPRVFYAGAGIYRPRARDCD